MNQAEYIPLAKESDMTNINWQDLKSSLKFENLWFDLGICVWFTDLYKFENIYC